MQVKGTAISFIPSFVKEKFRNEKYNGWLNSLPPSSEQVFSTSILVSSWYPLHAAMAIPVKRICDTFYAGDLKGATEVGRYSADFGLKGIYKLAIKLGTPEGLATRASALLSSYYQPIESQVIEAVPREAVFRIMKFPEMDQLVENRIVRFCQGGIDISGGKNVRTEVSPSMVRKGPYSDFITKWD